MYTRARLGVGYLPQEPSVFRKLSVADNIRLVLELREDLDRNARESELASLMDELQVGHVSGQIGASLSRSEEHTSELQSLMRISSGVFCLTKKSNIITIMRTS